MIQYFFSSVLLQGKKLFLHNILTKKYIHSRETLKKKKFMLLENPPPPTPITFLMVRPLAITFHQVILQSSFWQSKFKNKTKNSKNTFQSASLALGIRFDFCLLHLLTASLRKLEHRVMTNKHNRIWGANQMHNYLNKTKRKRDY